AWLAVKAGICKLPASLSWGHVIGAGILGGIGFTMSIFITNLAYAGQDDIIHLSKMAILAGSLLSGIVGWCWLKAMLPAKLAT
ncbi:MAG TPA: Na+/H+ antiporter NhaA, partial [Methylophilus sp.]|uniref:Na+/H+ antiporter NhaA n=1 Tax=Methylophilus sp. TaxID=29541 RepID=UPI002B987B24